MTSILKKQKKEQNIDLGVIYKKIKIQFQNLCHLYVNIAIAELVGKAQLVRTVTRTVPHCSSKYSRTVKHLAEEEKSCP